MVDVKYEYVLIYGHKPASCRGRPLTETLKSSSMHQSPPGSLSMVVMTFICTVEPVNDMFHPQTRLPTKTSLYFMVSFISFTKTDRNANMHIWTFKGTFTWSAQSRFSWRLCNHTQWTQQHHPHNTAGHLTNNSPALCLQCQACPQVSSTCISTIIAGSMQTVMCNG